MTQSTRDSDRVCPVIPQGEERGTAARHGEIDPQARRGLPRIRDRGGDALGRIQKVVVKAPTNERDRHLAFA
jgi:hypothetical protein